MPQAKKNSQTSAKNQVTAEAQSAEKSTPDNPNPEHFESTPEDEEEPSEVSDFKFKDFLLFCVKKNIFYFVIFFYVISKVEIKFLSLNKWNYQYWYPWSFIMNFKFFWNQIFKNYLINHAKKDIFLQFPMPNFVQHQNK